MIKNKKGISNIVIALIFVVVAILVFTLSFPNMTNKIKNQINDKASIDQYLPGKILATTQEPVTNELKIYSFDIIKKMLDDTYLTPPAKTKPANGSFLLIKRDIIAENALLGFVQVNGENRVYTSLSTNNLFSSSDVSSAKISSSTYFDTTLFEITTDRDVIRDLVEDKIFVVMSREENDYDEVLFLHYSTGLPLRTNSAKKRLTDPYYSFEKILERNTVSTVAFSTGKEAVLYYENSKGDGEKKTIAAKGNNYILIYRTDNYIVFLPYVNRGGAEINSDHEVYGTGLVNEELVSDLEKEGMLIKIE